MLRWLAMHRAAGFPVDRLQAHAVREVSHLPTTDRGRFYGQLSHHAAAGAAAILQVEGVDPGHDSWLRFPDRRRLVVERVFG